MESIEKAYRERDHVLTQIRSLARCTRRVRSISQTDGSSGSGPNDILSSCRLSHLLASLALLVALAAAAYPATALPARATTGYALIFDGGPTGTRVHTFELRPNGPAAPTVHPKPRLNRNASPRTSPFAPPPAIFWRARSAW